MWKVLFVYIPCDPKKYLNTYKERWTFIRFKSVFSGAQYIFRVISSARVGLNLKSGGFFRKFCVFYAKESKSKHSDLYTNFLPVT